MASLPTIPEFYAGKTVFITGGSGFIGKVLVEKLLRSCPHIKNIYLLMREKKNKSLEERLQAIIDLPLFDLLRETNPGNLSKVKAMPGDVCEPGLGLSAADRRLLQEQVNVIFHGAASVRFDDSLTDAVIMNTRGTRELVKLALDVEHLDVLVHISTTYCNTDRPVIGEKLYPAHADWRKTIEIAENVDKNTLNTLTNKYIAPLPNTYTFTKSLGEHVVHDLCSGKVPTVIFRPSVVIASAQEPLIGWVDNFNGPVGLVVACGKGVVRTVYGNPDIITDYVPVDMAVRALIISSWNKATAKDRLSEIAFYNASNNNMRCVTTREMVEMGKEVCWEVPFNTILWYPNTTVTNCYYYHMIKFIFYQLLPAVVMDGLMRVTGQKPMLLKIQRRIHVAMMALQYFAQNQWQFLNDNTMQLEKTLLPSDMDAFAYKTDEVSVLQYFMNSARGGRRYLVKESDDTFEQAKKNSRRMWIMSRIFNFVWYLAVFWLIFVKIDVVSYALKKYNDAYLYLTTD